MKVNSRVTVLLLIFALFSGNQQVFAESRPVTDLINLSLDELSEVTIATRTSRSSSEIPSTVYVYTQDEIRRHGWNSLAELVQHIPGVDVVNKTRGITLSVRGVGDLNFHGNKTVVMIDGHTYSYPSQGSPGFGGLMNQYDILNARRVEVQVGPAGTLHGANAFGITINIITMDPEHIDGAEADIFYGSQGETIPSLRFGKRNGAWGLFQSFTGWRQTDSDLSSVPISQNPDTSLVVYNNDTFEGQTNSNYDLHGYVDYDHKFRIGYRVSNVDSGRGTALVSTQKGRVIADQHSIYLDFNKSLTDKLTYQLTSHYTKTKLDSTDSYFIDTIRNRVGTSISNADSFVMDNQFTYFQNNKLTWVGGVFLERSQRRAAAVRFALNTTDPGDRLYPPLNPEEDFDNGAAYLQAEWIPSDKFYFVSGLRYVTTEERYPSELIPRLGMRYVLSDKWLTKFNYQKGFRAPNVGDGRQRGAVAGNPDIASELIDSIELTLEGKPTSDTGLRATYFYSRIEDLITRVPFSGGGGFTSIDDNIGKVIINGLELEVNYKFNNKLRVESSFTYTDSKNKTDGIDTRTIVPYKLNFTLISQPAPNWEFTWDNYFRWKPTSDINNALLQGSDADDWLLSNLTITRKKAFNIHDLNLVLSIRNLFDEQYGHVDPRSTVNPGTPFLTSFHPQERRNFLVGLNYRF